MPQWIDKTPYNEMAREQEPRDFELDIGDGFVIKIHKYAWLHDEWDVFCDAIGLYKETGTTDSQKAKEKSLSMVYLRLKELIDRYEQAALSIKAIKDLV